MADVYIVIVLSTDLNKVSRISDREVVVEEYPAQSIEAVVDRRRERVFWRQPVAYVYGHTP